ncbi:hypothetical protein CR155_16130 [Pollutimonas nitritireducens]|uniref:DUF4148 domain-containing protein n=1 Tax=Pollutimonas nitritireducens TaxID=2045209 RepID=A0A2N4UD24_9BURK|nr:DUF4148 domain-containing protein [Pollutimonas nitritireducens]PLC52929.1 hypothetical protein CR155_16130 [Pollutimonas nitritireducens]
MNLRTKTIMTLLAAALTIPATGFAAWIPDGTEQGGYEVYDSTNNKTRAQVLQELQEAKQSSHWSMHQGEATGSWSEPTAEPAKTRVVVQQDLQKAKQSSHWDTHQGQATGTWSEPTAEPAKTRAAVQ